MNYSTSHRGGQGDSKSSRQNRFLVVPESEPPDIVGIFPVLFYVIGGALVRLRKASAEVMLEVDVDIELNHQIGSITDGQRALLVEINTLRNKLAHQIMFESTIDDLRGLWTRASRAFTDMTDGIDQSLGELGTAKNPASLGEWVFPELFVQICYDLHEKYVELGGDVEANSAGYPISKKQAVLSAVAEAWQWLEHDGLVIADPDQPNGFFCLTRKGQALKSASDIEAYRFGKSSSRGGSSSRAGRESKADVSPRRL